MSNGFWSEKGNRYTGAWTGKTSYRQPKPHTRPLPYETFGGTSRVTWVHPQYGTNSDRNPDDIRNGVALGNGWGWTIGVAKAQNKALDKLYEQFEQAESLRVAWKERQKAIDMATAGVRTIVRIARAVKRRDPRIVRAIIGKNPEKKDILKTPSDIWLGYHFGIKPTLQDIHHSLGIFGFDPPVMKLTAKGSSSEIVYGGGDYSTKLVKTSITLGGEIYQFDPNVSLASRLGFAQPLSVAWEMTPFSWFVDYFTNVGQLIKNLEPRFPGIQTRFEYTSRFVRYAPAEYTGFGVRTVVNSGFYANRVIGWPSYSLEFPAVEGLKLQQLSYITAVAIQLLTSMKK